MCLFSHQKQQDPGTGHGLRKNRCQCGAPHAHVQPKYKNRIKNDIGHRADQHRQHAGPCKSLRCDKSVHPQRHLHKNRSERIDIHIGYAIIHRIGAGPEGQQEVPVPQQQRRCQQDRDDHLHHKTIAERLLRFLILSLSHEDRRPRRDTVSHKRGKG